MPDEKPIEEIEAILSEEQIRSLQLIETLRLIRPLDLAPLLVHFDPDEKIKIFEHLETEAAAEVLFETDPRSREEILETASVEKLAPIIGEMPPDEEADLVEGLPTERRDALLRLSPEIADEVRPLLGFDPETAGGKMTTEYVSVPESETAGGAIKAIQGNIDAETVSYVYVLDEGRHLRGVLSVRELIASRPETALADIMTTDLITAPPEMDQEDVAMAVQKYNLQAMPVVESSGRMLGIVTVDDVIDVIQSEVSEDMYQLAGTTGRNPTVARFHVQILTRAPFLLITLAGGLAIVFVESRYEHLLASIVAIGFFIPLIMGMAGNVGIQSSTIVVRGLATGEIQPERMLTVLRREIAAGLALGVIFGTLCWGAGTLYTRISPEAPDGLGYAVGLGMFAGLSVAALVGSFVPIACERLGLDPALAAGPFVTMLNDLIALAVYLGISITFLTAPA